MWPIVALLVTRLIPQFADRALYSGFRPHAAFLLGIFGKCADVAAAKCERGSYRADRLSCGADGENYSLFDGEFLEYRTEEGGRNLKEDEGLSRSVRRSSQRSLENVRTRVSRPNSNSRLTTRSQYPMRTSSKLIWPQMLVGVCALAYPRARKRRGLLRTRCSPGGTLRPTPHA